MAIKQLTPTQAHDVMQKDPSVIYLDVRTEPEFTAGHPQRGVNIPAFFFQAPGRPTPNPEFLKVVEANIPKDAAIIVGCQAGGRSQRAAEMLAQAGYTNVCNMMGGFGGGQDQAGNPIPGWRDAGLPVSNDNSEGVSYASLATKAGVKV
ncbi:MAG TPA: rhodanese-like domain-containing protein [Methylomirabilota bacterium]|jgi:rhodanese-related sulfurtransferase|nr:rhodanese-like domain-containing protein [Methylomirabilota bacterium]